MELSQLNFCKLNELKIASDDRAMTSTLPIVEGSTSFKPEFPKCDKEDEFNCISDAKDETRDDNNNSLDNFKSCYKKAEKFVPNIIARKYLNSKNRTTIIDSNTESFLQCQCCSFKTKDVSRMSKHIKFTHETKACNNNVLSLLKVPRDTPKVETSKTEKSEWRMLNFLLTSPRDTCESNEPKIKKKLEVEGTHHLGNVKINVESEDIKYDPDFKNENDYVEKSDQEGKPEAFPCNWNIIYDENNNDLDELIERQNGVEVTKKFQNFLVRNYIAVGKNIPEIVELIIDDTRIVNIDFHVCPMCEKKLENYSAFKDHLTICEKQPYFICVYCSYKAKHVDILKDHIHKRHLYHLRNKLFECPRCYKIMANQNSLNVHLSYCGTERNLQCNICSYRTNIKSNLRTHILRIHSYDVQECPQCNKKFKNLPCLTAHLKYCKKNLTLQSDSYNRTSVHSILKTRCSDVHKIDGKFTKHCPQCLHFLGSSRKMNCCLCKSRLLYQCRKCDKAFDTYRTLFYHASKCSL